MEQERIQCLTCLFEKSSGIRVDNSKTNKDWGKEIGVNEASIRRHKKHVLEASADSYGENENGEYYATISSTEAWGYEDFRNFIRSKGQDPDKVTFSWGVTSNPGGGYWNKLNRVRPKDEAEDLATLEHLYAEVEARGVPRAGQNRSKRATVVCLADWQLGKTGRRGGTADTLHRLSGTRDKLERLYDEREPGVILLFDLGDGIEGFESGGDPQFTNDLSLPDQLDAYSTEMFKFVSQAYAFAEVRVAAVPSNHSAWRRGKQNLGRPSDDFGLYVHKEVAKVSKAAGYEVEWVFPEEYDESVAVDLNGTIVAGVHGNQFGPNKAIDWWQGQAFGSQASTRADVLVTGHYHSFGAGVAGLNPFSGKERFWLGAPTVDNGSDWYRGLKGRDSLPGTLVFDVTEEGFDLGSLTII